MNEKQRRDDLKAQAVIEAVVSCVRRGFTGTLQVEWKDGTPQLVRTTTVQRFTDDGALTAAP